METQKSLSRTAEQLSLPSLCERSCTTSTWITEGPLTVCHPKWLDRQNASKRPLEDMLSMYSIKHKAWDATLLYVTFAHNVQEEQAAYTDDSFQENSWLRHAAACKRWWPQRQHRKIPTAYRWGSCQHVLASIPQASSCRTLSTTTFDTETPSIIPEFGRGFWPQSDNVASVRSFD